VAGIGFILIELCFFFVCACHAGATRWSREGEGFERRADESREGDSGFSWRDGVVGELQCP